MAKSRIGRAEQRSGWLFIAPTLVLLGLFMVYPIIWSLWMSFQTGRGMSHSFGGLTNIIRLTQDPVFLRALTNTGIFLVVQVRGGVGAGLGGGAGCCGVGCGLWFIAVLG